MSGIDDRRRAAMLTALRAGTPGCRVAQLHGVHENTVYALAKAHGVNLRRNGGGRGPRPRLKLTPAVARQVEQRCALGHSVAAIARALGIGKSTVLVARRQASITQRASSRPLADATIEDIRRRAQAGESVKAIAQALHVGRPRIFKALASAAQPIAARPGHATAGYRAHVARLHSERAAFDGEVRALFLAGRSDSEICRATGRSTGVVEAARTRQKLSRIKTPAPFDAAEDALLRQLFKAGLGDAEIAQRLGRGSREIYPARRRLDLLRHGPRLKWFVRVSTAGPAADALADEIKVLRRAGFVVHREGTLYRVGTRQKTPDEVQEMAGRWARQLDTPFRAPFGQAGVPA